MKGTALSFQVLWLARLLPFDILNERHNLGHLYPPRRAVGSFEKTGTNTPAASLNSPACILWQPHALQSGDRLTILSCAICTLSVVSIDAETRAEYFHLSQYICIYLFNDADDISYYVA
jgi:hypothetical protein